VLPSATLRPLLAALCAAGTSACGGGAPLLHPAHVLTPGNVTVGAGLSGQPVLRSLSAAPGTAEANAEAVLETRMIAPALAPWVSARVGITGSNEAGLTYTGRAARLDGRHGFKLSKSLALSAGLGGEVILAGRRDAAGEPTLMAGGGVDVPVLFGWMSTGGLYSGWIGPRAGFRWIRGEVTPTAIADATDIRVGLVEGMRHGFRYFHVALEIAGDWHEVSGSVGDIDVSTSQISLTPAGALILSF